ncbi:MAG TPA: heparan-alpha-glucosaminide N-acetyltransferase domain-containing protein, partial [Chitinophagaceae bacterium]|nr:heparan-alpha-glucosaminide N-acetyltransferase domain-containing protein [Chitinophagaceae bacterium]
MRIREIDFARGFTVLIMAPVHTVLVFGDIAVRQGTLGKILAFLAEGPGAPLFMMLMGISFTFSTHNKVLPSFRRALQLLILAYLLNALKFLVPWFMGWISPRMLSDFGLSPRPQT